MKKFFILVILILSVSLMGCSAKNSGIKYAETVEVSIPNEEKQEVSENAKNQRYPILDISIKKYDSNNAPEVLSVMYYNQETYEINTLIVENWKDNGIHLLYAGGVGCSYIEFISDDEINLYLNTNDASRTFE